MAVWVITGANRGLGLEFVAQLSRDSANTIIATSRSMTVEALADLNALKTKSVHILECDAGSADSIEAFAKQVSVLLGTRKIDFLLNNAGVNVQSQQTALNVTAEAITENMLVNVLGPAKIVQVLDAHLQSGSVVMNMTSGLGSMTESRGGGKCTPYSISKAGVNMLTLHQASELGPRGVVVVCVDPGWVKTRCRCSNFIPFLGFLGRWRWLTVTV